MHGVHGSPPSCSHEEYPSHVPPASSSPLRHDDHESPFELEDELESSMEVTSPSSSPGPVTVPPSTTESVTSPAAGPAPPAPVEPR
ncbi:unnamed protein product [Linum trigynum]